jgi:hypothetical protein
MLAIISIVIGLVFVLLLFSMLTSALVEVYHSFRASRGNHLKETIEMMLGPEKARHFIEHPYFKQLSSATKPNAAQKLPVWIDKGTFSTILADILTPESGLTVQQRIDKIENDELRKVMNFLWRQSGGDAKLFQAKVEHWFEEVMVRAKEWFIDATKWRLFFFGTALAAALNADTVQIYKSLSANANLRDEVVKAAEMFSNSADTVLVYRKVSAKGAAPQQDSVVTVTAASDTTEARANFMKIKGMYDQTIASPLGLGWSQSKPDNWWDWLTKVVGWLLTGVAVTMGAPFWFEMLKKLLALKGTVGGGSGGGGNSGSAAPPERPAEQPAFEIRASNDNGRGSSESEAVG